MISSTSLSSLPSVFFTGLDFTFAMFEADVVYCQHWITHVQTLLFLLMSCFSPQPQTMYTYIQVKSYCTVFLKWHSFCWNHNLTWLCFITVYGPLQFYHIMSLWAYLNDILLHCSNVVYFKTNERLFFVFFYLWKHLHIKQTSCSSMFSPLSLVVEAGGIK